MNTLNLLWQRLIGLNAEDLRRVSGIGFRLRNGGWLGWVAFGAILLGAFVWWCYARAKGHRGLTAGRRRVLMTLRLVLLTLILLTLLRPVLALSLEERLRRTVVLLVDSTKSMNIRDQRVDEADRKRAEIGMGIINEMDQGLDLAGAAEASQISRAELAKAVLENPKLQLMDDLQRDFKVETYLFGKDVAPVAGPTWLLDYHPSSDTTAIGDAVRNVLDRERGQPVAGIILITDGGNNAGSDPIAAADAAKRDGAPIYPYGVGITSPRDIIVSHLSAPEIAFANDAMAVTVQLRGQGLSGQTGHLSLKMGDTEVAASDVTFTGSDQLVPLSFTPAKKGEFELTASIPARDDEISAENNATGQRVRVIDDKIKVLYIEQGPRWEFRFLQGVLMRDRRIAPSFVLLDGDPDIAQEDGSPYLAKFPEDKAELLKYDLVIIGDVDPKTFSQAQLDGLDEFVSKFGGACLFIAGKNFMPEAYRGSDVEKMLPVELEPGNVAGGEMANRPVKLALTALGGASPMMMLANDPQQNAAAWAKFPPVLWDYEVARPKPAAQVLVVDPTRASQFGAMPVLATQQYGVGQVVYLGTDELWRWRKNEGVNAYPVLWGQIVQGTALAHLLGSWKKTQLSVDREVHDIGDPVTVYARLYNDRFQPISDPEVAAQYTVVTGMAATEGANQDLTLRAVPNEPGMYRGDFVAVKAGRYRVLVGDDTRTVVEFESREPRFELGETAMNEGLLKQMAQVSGGRFFREENLSGLVRDLNRKPETLRTVRDLDVWASPLYFALMCAVAGAEWILRKRWGLK
jgi:hypothetical protein